MRAIVVIIVGIVGLMALPSATASDLPTGTRIEGNCVWVYDFPDAGFAVCTGHPDCTGGLYTKTVTFIGTEERCVV